MSELIPCPFCGKPGTIWESRKLVPGYHDASRSVGCKACAYALASKDETTTWLESGRVETNTEEVDAYLASIWNNRVSPWRSLKDDPPTEYPVVICNPRRKAADTLLFKATPETLARGWTLWTELPS